MATAILHVPGRNAQFITQGPLNPDGKTVHGLLIAWYGPGPVEASSYLTAQAGAADTIHQDCSVETLKQLVLVGSHPQDIDDVSYSWSSADFAHAVDRP